MRSETTPEQRLARAVEKLTRPYTEQHQQRVIGGGRRIVNTQHASLISMLRTASLSTGGAHAGSGELSRSIVDSDAIEKLRQLRFDTLELWTWLLPGIARTGVLNGSGISHEQLLTAWHTHFITYRRAGLAHDRELDTALSVTGRWVRIIETKFDPVRTLELTDPCPDCLERWATIGIGELAARVSALQMTFGADRTSVTCRNCGHTWRGAEELHALARRLRTAGDTITPPLGDEKSDLRY